MGPTQVGSSNSLGFPVPVPTPNLSTNLPNASLGGGYPSYNVCPPTSSGYQIYPPPDTSNNNNNIFPPPNNNIYPPPNNNTYPPPNNNIYPHYNQGQY